MLSILIPVFNFDVRPLVRELQRQCQALSIPFEILVMDDASEPRFVQINAEHQSIEGIRFLALSENIGRAAIRNRMAELAQYSYLLYLDCDSGIVSPDFVKKYMAQLPTQKVLVGGRIYAEMPPADRRYLFHWHYGTYRESMPAATRSQQPYHSFMTNNFLIAKDLVLKNPFSGKIRTYGHEDTLFGWQLQQLGIEIVHFENSVLHLGLERTDDFLKKTQQALGNLVMLRQDFRFEQTKLVVWHRRISKLGLNRMAGRLFNALRPVLERHFHASHPNLRVFDFYKLGMFEKLLSEKTLIPEGEKRS